MAATRLPIRILQNELVLAIGLGCTALPMPALAQTATPVNDQIKQLQSEIRNIQKHYQTEIQKLQRQLDDLKAAQAAPKPPPQPTPGAPTTLQIPPTAGVLSPPAQAAPPPPAVAEAKRGGFLGSGIDLTIGGYIEAASIYRTRNETADISSNFNTAIPFPNSPNYHLAELPLQRPPNPAQPVGTGQGGPGHVAHRIFRKRFPERPGGLELDREQQLHSAATAGLRHPRPQRSRVPPSGGQIYSLLTLFNHDMTPCGE